MGYLRHSPPLHLAIAVVIALATLVLIYSISTSLYAYKNPTSSLFAKKRRPLLLRLPCLRGMVAAKELERQNCKHALLKTWNNPKQGSEATASSNTAKLEPAQMTLPPVVRSRCRGFFVDHSVLWLLILANVIV